jgi:hypothetical protein
MMRVAPLLLAGCFQSIAPDVPDASPFEPTSGKFATSRRADGSFTTIVDASSETAPTLGDFETGTAALETDPWDLAFQRFRISPASGVEIALVEAAFVDVAVAPASGWSTAPVDDWYDYDSTTHVLTPRAVTYALRTPASTLKLEIENYYDDAGNAGFFTLHWRSL